MYKSGFKFLIPHHRLKMAGALLEEILPVNWCLNPLPRIHPPFGVRRLEIASFCWVEKCAFKRVMNQIFRERGLRVASDVRRVSPNLKPSEQTYRKLSSICVEHIYTILWVSKNILSSD